jgi:hypothetical protein
LSVKRVPSEESICQMEQNTDITVLNMTLIPIVELKTEVWEEARSLISN